MKESNTFFEQILYKQDQIKEADGYISQINDQLKYYNAKVAWLLEIRSNLEQGIKDYQDDIKELMRESLIVKK